MWLTNFDPTIGHEIKKIRPAVIIQNNVGNKFGPITIVAPITSKKIDNIIPVEVFLGKKYGLEKDSKALLSQIRAIDKRRIVKKVGSLDEDAMSRVDNAIRISFGLVNI